MGHSRDFTNLTVVTNVLSKSAYTPVRLCLRNYIYELDIRCVILES